MLFDNYQRLAPRPYDPSVQVRIFAIDEDSLKHLGQWPWPRDTLARIVGRLTADGAAAIAIRRAAGRARPDRAPGSAEAMAGPARYGSLERCGGETAGSGRANLAKALAIAPAVLAFSLNDQPGGQTPAVKAGIAMAGDDALPWLLSPAGRDHGTARAREGHAGLRQRHGSPGSGRYHAKRPVAVRLPRARSIRAWSPRRSGSPSQARRPTSSRPRTRAARPPWAPIPGLNNVKVGGAIIPVDSHGNVLLYDSGFQPKRFISLWRVLEPDFDPNLVSGQHHPDRLDGGRASGISSRRPSTRQRRASKPTPRSSSRSWTTNICSGPTGPTARRCCSCWSSGSP